MSQGILPAPWYGNLSAAGASVALPPGQWSAVTLTNGDAGAIVLGNVCYLSANDTARKAFANGTEAQATVVCMCLDASIAAGQTGRFVFGGLVTGLSGGTVNTLGYLSTTAGAITNTPNLTVGQFNVLLGIWQSASKFQNNFQLPILN